MVIGIKQRIIEDTDGSSSRNGDQEDEDVMKVGDVDEDEIRAKLAQEGPSSDAMAKFTDYRASSYFKICRLCTVLSVDCSHSLYV